MEMGSPRDFMAVSSGTRSGLVPDVLVSDILFSDREALTSHHEPLRLRDHCRVMRCNRCAVATAPPQRRARVHAAAATLLVFSENAPLAVQRKCHPQAARDSVPRPLGFNAFAPATES